VEPTLDTRIARALDVMQHQVAEPWTIRTLAALVGLSPSRFAHLFRRATGTSPLRFLHTLRMTRARQLLEDTPLPVRDVMRLVGWKDPSHFSRDFQRRFGVGPRRYRAAHAVNGPGDEGRRLTDEARVLK